MIFYSLGQKEELPFLQSILFFSITYCMPPMAIKRKLLPKKRKTKIRLCSKDRSSTFYTFLTPFLVGYKVLWQQSEAVKAKPHLKFGSFVLLLDIKEMASNWNSYGKEIWNQSIMQISYLHKQNINEVWFQLRLQILHKLIGQVTISKIKR